MAGMNTGTNMLGPAVNRLHWRSRSHAPPWGAVCYVVVAEEPNQSGPIVTEVSGPIPNGNSTESSFSQRLPLGKPLCFSG